jgi:hypothetical protein
MLIRINIFMEPQNPINLKQYGIDIGLLISGLFGAILLTSKGSAMNLARTFSSLVGGAASANYITPVIISVTKLENMNFQYSIAFILGYLGLRSLDYFISKVLSNFILSEESIQTSSKRSRSNNKRK